MELLNSAVFLRATNMISSSPGPLGLTLSTPTSKKTFVAIETIAPAVLQSTKVSVTSKNPML